MCCRLRNAGSPPGGGNDSRPSPGFRPCSRRVEPLPAQPGMVQVSPYLIFLLFVILKQTFRTYVANRCSMAKRGAQPNNHNALKHGFYSHNFKAGELSDLDQLTPDLTNEINLLRVALRRLYEFADEQEPDIKNAIDVLNAVNTTTANIGNLIRLQQVISGQSNDNIAQHLSQALSETIEEIRCRKPQLARYSET